jgi:hypothetical protein
MTNEWRNDNDESRSAPSRAVRCLGFGFRHCRLIRHSDFVIVTREGCAMAEEVRL